MECTIQTWPSNEEYFMQFNKKAYDLRTPLTGTLDLTYRCNLHCIHCYLGNNAHVNKNNEMSTAQLCTIIDEITEAGCLYFLITGGEPFLRSDFPQVYRHAKENGLIITIFTNGTFVTNELIDLFRDLPPYAVEITLYGSTPETYERITGVPGSFSKCLEGIQKLHDNRISVKLKTILMTLNSHEFFDIEQMAKDYGLKFRFDAAIFPRFDGDKDPLHLRVSPDEAVSKEFSDVKRARDWARYFQKSKDRVLSGRLYNCGAGITAFHIDPYGYLKPCLMIDTITYNLLRGSFLEGWKNVICKIMDLKEGDIVQCNTCEKRHLCSFCPAFFKRENGREDILSEYVCTMADHRFQKVQDYL